MAKRSSKNNRWGVLELARRRPFAAAAAAAAGAAAAGLFLWSKRAQISEQLNDLSDKVGQWAENMRETVDDGESATDADTESGSGTRRSARRKPSRSETSAVEDTSAE